MILVLLRPRYLGFAKRWSTKAHGASALGRDFVVLLFSLSIAYAIYSGALAALDSLLHSQNLISIYPAQSLAVLMLLVFFLLLFSSLAAGLGTFFFAKDLELLLQAPIPRLSFFFSRNLEVFSHAAWMAVVFIVPVLIAFAEAYEAPFEFYFLSLGYLLLFFEIPVLLGITLILGFGYFFSAKRAREILILSFAILLVIILNFLRLYALPEGGGGLSSGEALTALTRSELNSIHWVPSYWLATTLADALFNDYSRAVFCLVALLSANIFLFSAAYYLFDRFYVQAHSSAQAIQLTHQQHSVVSSDVLRRASLIIPAQARALFAKEFRLFARDMTQAVQLILLIGLCMIYLFNFRILDAVENIPESNILAWRALLVISNMVMGSFVITAVAARFVFPSVSLEGKSFWILQSAPIELSSLLRIKFWFWFLPLGFISAVIILSGALAVQAEPQIVATSALCATIISFGIVGLGIGLGAAFAQFDWDYSAQLTSSIGNLIFMISSALYILLSMVPIVVLILLRTLRTFGVEFSPLAWYSAVTICAFLFVYLSYLVRRFAIRVGISSLEKKLSP